MQCSPIVEDDWLVELLSSHRTVPWLHEFSFAQPLQYKIQVNFIFYIYYILIIYIPWTTKPWKFQLIPTICKHVFSNPCSWIDPANQGCHVPVSMGYFTDCNAIIECEIFGEHPYGGDWKTQIWNCQQIRFGSQSNCMGTSNIFGICQPLPPDSGLSEPVGRSIPRASEFSFATFGCLVWNRCATLFKLLGQFDWSPGSGDVQSWFHPQPCLEMG